jgi:hypothetical protein
MAVAAAHRHAPTIAAAKLIADNPGLRASRLRPLPTLPRLRGRVGRGNETPRGASERDASDREGIAEEREAVATDSVKDSWRERCLL